MKKRISIFIVLIFALMGFSACKKSPYEKMDMSVDNSQINLTIDELDDKQLVGGKEIVNVAVIAPKNVSNSIVLPKYGEGYGNEYVDITIISNDAQGNYQLQFQAKKQGYTEVEIKTLEGYLSETIEVNIGVKLKELNFKADAKVVVEAGASYDFNTYGKSLLNFVPSYTTETNVDFTLEKEYPGVKIVNNVLKVEYGVPAGEVNVRASSKDGNVFTLTYLKVKIIEPLILNQDSMIETKLGDIEISQNKVESTMTTARYELIFASPNVELDAGDNPEGSLVFGGNFNIHLTDRDDYKITHQSDFNDVVDITEMNTEVSSPTAIKKFYKKTYNFSAKDVGEYNAVFKIEYVGDTDNGQYDGLYTKYIHVKVTVIPLPTSKTIYINEDNYKNGSNVIAVYDAYAMGNGSKLTVTCSNNGNMTYKISNNTLTDVEIKKDNVVVDPTLDLFKSGDTLFLKNISGATKTLNLRLTLTTDVSNQYYSTHADLATRQTFSKSITIKLNLITGLDKLVIEDKTGDDALDIVEDSAGIELCTFAEGVIAESVVESVKFGDSRLFTYKFGEGSDANKLYIYPAKFNEGDTEIFEGATNLVVYLTNGVRSYNMDPDEAGFIEQDTTIEVKATYETWFNPGTGVTAPVVVANLDTENDGFFAFGEIKDKIEDVSYPIGFNTKFEDDHEYYTIEEGKAVAGNGERYNHFSNLIVSTYSEINLDLFKLFIFNNKIAYVNKNTLAVKTIMPDGTSAADKIFWKEGKLYVYGTTTYNSSQRYHEPYKLEIYDGSEKIYEINVFVCHRIAKVSLEKTHFELYDNASHLGKPQLNSVYSNLSTSTIQLKIWIYGENGEIINTPLIQDVENGRFNSDEFVYGVFGNIHQYYNMIGAKDKIYEYGGRSILREDLLQDYNADEAIVQNISDYSEITAKVNTSKVSGDFTDILNSIFNNGKTQNISFDGRASQFNNEFVIAFNVEISRAIRSSSIQTNVDELGIYFEEGQANKSYQFTYNIYPVSTTFTDLFVNVGGKTVRIFNGDYGYNASGNKIKLYKTYTSGFDADKYMGDTFDESAPTGEYFLVEINKGLITIEAINMPAGNYEVQISTVDSYNSGMFECNENFNFYIADGAINTPYQIRNTSAFERFLTKNKLTDPDVDTPKYYVIVKDIHLNKTFTNTDLIGNELNNHLSGQFVTTIDGEKIVLRSIITGLSINLNGVAQGNYGLFSEMGNGSLSYVSVEEATVNVLVADITNDINIGVLVGKVDESSVVGCKVDGSIIVNAFGTNVGNKELNIGGMVGSYTGGALSTIPEIGVAVNNSDINSTIRIEYTSDIPANLGGIVGAMRSGTTIDSMRAVANIYAKAKTKVNDEEVFGESNIGGIVGLSDSSTILNVISYPAVIGKENIGGIVGLAQSTVIKYSQSQILHNLFMKNIVAGLNNVGGLAGKVTGSTSINYSYVRSYTTKEINQYWADNKNINFIGDYSAKYYGSVVLLNDKVDGTGGNVGGLVGTSTSNLQVSNSNFTSALVSFDSNPNMGGIVGLMSSATNKKITLNNSYVDGKIVYLDQVNRKYINSFNMITVPSESSQKFISTTVTPVIEREGTLSNAQYSYLSITSTRTWKNAPVEYTQKFANDAGAAGIETNKFYAKMNNSLFGIQGDITDGTFTYRSYSDKMERISLIVYNDGAKLRLIANVEIYENTPSGVMSYKKTFGTGNKHEYWNETTIYNKDLLRQIAILGLEGYEDAYRYYLSESAIDPAVSYNTESTELFNKFIYVGGLKESGTFDDFNAVLDAINSKSTIEIAGYENKSTMSVIKTLDGFEDNVYADIITGGELYSASKIYIDVNGERYVFNEVGTSKKYTWDDTNPTTLSKHQIKLVSSGVVSYEAISDLEQQNNGGTITNLDPDKNDAVYIGSTVAVKGADNKYTVYSATITEAGVDYAGAWDYRIAISADNYKYFDLNSIIGTQGSLSSRGFLFAIGQTYVIYTDKEANIIDGKVDENNDGYITADEKYEIVGGEIYNNGVKVSSTPKNYYKLRYSMYVENGDISLSNNRIPGLYSDKGITSIEELFDFYVFSYNDGEIKIDHDKDGDGTNETYYQHGNDWYTNSSFDEKIEDEEILSQLIGKKSDSYYNIKLKAYYNEEDKKWYSDSTFNTYLCHYDEAEGRWEGGLDPAITKQFIGKTGEVSYFDRYTVTYQIQNDWLFFVLIGGDFYEVRNNIVDEKEFTRMVVEQRYLGNDSYEKEFEFKFQNGNFFYDNGDGHYCIDLYDIDGNKAPITTNQTLKVYVSRWKSWGGDYITDISKLGQLNGKVQNGEEGNLDVAYYLENWYTEPEFVNKVDKETSKTLVDKLATNSEYKPGTKITSFKLTIGGNSREITDASGFDLRGDINATIISKIRTAFGFTPSKPLGIMIENNMLYLVSTDPEKAIETIILNNEKHYVLAKTYVSSSDSSKWLITNKINNNLPVTIIPNYNLDLIYDEGEYKNSALVYNYKLYYDELAMLSLRANEFTPNAPDGSNDYIDSDGHHGFIKVDDSSVVLMYNSDAGASENQYEIAFGEQEGNFVAILNGVVVDLSAVEIDAESALQLVITTTRKSVAEIVKNGDNFKVLVHGEGEAVFNFYNLKDDGIKVSLNVNVIKGFTNFEITDKNGVSVSNLYARVGDDDPTNYLFNFVNKINNRPYEANNGGFKLQLISIDGKDSGFDASKTYSSVNINGKEISKENFVELETEFDFDSENLSFLAINRGTDLTVPMAELGKIHFRVIPYVIVNDNKVYIDGLEKDIVLDISNPAYRIEFSETNTEQLPEEEKSVSVIVYSNYAQETIDLYVSGGDWSSTEKIEISEANYGLYTLPNSLLQFRLKNYSSDPIPYEGINLYKYTFTIAFSMNIDNYIAMTQSTGVNAIAKSVSYSIVAEPSSNNRDNGIVVGGKTGLSSTYSLTINPVNAYKLSYNFYPYLKATKENGLPAAEATEIAGFKTEQIYDIHALTPGEYGLLKIETSPKFNDTLVMQIEFDEKYVGIVSFEQVSPVFNKDYDYRILKSNNVNISNRYVLWEMPYVYTDPSDPANDIYFLGEYYVAVKLSKNCPQGQTIPFVITAFDDERKEVLKQTFNLYVESIPQLEISIDGKKSVVKGVNEYVPLDITAKNIDNVAGSLELTNDSGKIYPIYVKNGESFRKVDFNTTVFNPNEQYYLGTTIDDVVRLNGNTLNGSVSNIQDSIRNIKLTLSTTKNINGKEFDYEDSVNVQIVWLTIESVVEPEVVNGKITLKTGMYKGLDVTVATNKYDDFEKFTEMINKYGNSGDIDIDGHGMSFEQYLDSIEKTIAGRGYVDGENEVSFWYYNSSPDNYEHLESNLYSSFMFNRYEGVGERYFRISAIQADTLRFRLFFNFRYEDNGTISISKEPIVDGEAYEYYFDMVIKENSSQDSPIPIYNVEDLMSMVSGENYILQNDLTLTNWTPMTFNSAYLDGNGFTITINSFNTSNLKGKDEVYAGLFDRINENCIVKNLNINVSNLLYSDNALSDVKNDEVTPNIDLRETAIVYFGLLAGENLGTIINVKVVNTDSRKDNQTLYVAVSRLYKDEEGESVSATGYIGGLVASNSGVITNSFIGLNINEEIEKTKVVDTGNQFSTVMVGINPFRISSCNNLGGFVYLNTGTITNSYLNSVSLENYSENNENNSTAGFVAQNGGNIYSSAVTTNNIKEFRSNDTSIDATSKTAGFVYSNDGVVEDCYTNIRLVNSSLETAGFVFANSGSIKNSYTTTKREMDVVGNTKGHGLFVFDKTLCGPIENCYYLIYDNELGKEIDDPELLRSLDPANAIIKQKTDDVTIGEFVGYSFATAADEYDGAWYLDSTVKEFPRLSYSEHIEYYSSRNLVNIDTTHFEVVPNGIEMGMNVFKINAENKVEEVLESYNTLDVKTSVWYFKDGLRLYEVIGNSILNVDDKKQMIVTRGEDAIPNGEYFQFEDYGKTYKIYYTSHTNRNPGYNVSINGTAYKIANFKFTYLGYEFVVVRSSNGATTEYTMVTNNGFNIVTLEKELATIEGITNAVFSFGGNSTYTYSNVKNNPGSKPNPLIVTNSEEFAKYIVNETNEYVLAGDDNGDGERDRVYIFGLTENTGDGVYARYVQLANDINFRNEDEETDRNIAASYEVNNSTTKITINDVIFNGVFIGNSMSINNIILNSTETRENYGIFNEVGINDKLKGQLPLIGIPQTNIATAQVFNIALNYQELSNKSANKVGLLAGTISNATINKVDISGPTEINEISQILGKNLTGALAGLIYGSEKNTKISEITVENVNVGADTNNLTNVDGGTIIVNQEYTSFRESHGDTYTIEEIKYSDYKELAKNEKGEPINRNGNIISGVTYADGNPLEAGKIIPTKYIDGVAYDNIGSIIPAGNIANVSRFHYISYRKLVNLTETTTNKQISYAGAVAGAIVIDKAITDDKLMTNNLDNYTSYNTLRNETTNYVSVSDLTVGGAVNVLAEISGGVAGYVGTSGKLSPNMMVIENESYEYVEANFVTHKGTTYLMQSNNLYPAGGGSPVTAVEWRYVPGGSSCGIFLSDLKFELDEDLSQNIYGYGYAGGVVGQANHAYFMQTMVEHDRETQDVIDKRINELSSKDISKQTLFNKNSQGVVSSEAYNVAIGGIVGRMNSTWIVDSYSKVNVENKNSFIGGGVVGHATGNSYLAYVYATGNVLAKNIIGGLVGYYHNSASDKYNLNLYNTIAVNVWNGEVDDEDDVQSIKELLKINEKAYKYKYYNGTEWVELAQYPYVMGSQKHYLGDAGVKSFVGEFNSMPELGNQKTARSLVADKESLYLEFYVDVVEGNVKIKNSAHEIVYSFNFDISGGEEDRDIIYKGYEFTLKYDDGKVTCAEKPMFDEEKTVYTSYYSVKATNNPAGTGGSITITPYIKIEVNNANDMIFTTDERFTFIGSVLGRYSKGSAAETLSTVKFYNDFSEISEDNGYGTNSNELNEIISRVNNAAGGNTEEYYTYYNKFNFNVISSTYGEVEHEGKLSEGNYVSTIKEDKINLSYFKSVYASDGDNKEYNAYDIENFRPMFGKQYYVSYITGDFVNNSTSDLVGNKYYKNEFTTYYGFVYDVEYSTPKGLWKPPQNGELYLSDSSLDSLKTIIENGGIASLEYAVTGVNFEPSQIWYVDNGYSLAKYGYNSNDTFALVDSEKDMYDALTLGKSGMMYRIDKNMNHVRLNGANTYEVYTGSYDDKTCGTTKPAGTTVNEWATQYHVIDLGTTTTRYGITNNTYYSAEPTTIYITLAQGVSVSNVFDVVTGSTFININFVIDISKKTGIRTNNYDNFMGFFANVTQGCVFDNCSFSIAGGTNIEIMSAQGNDGAPESMGMVVGLASNTVFKDCSFDISNVGTITATDSLINFGGVFGQTYQSTIKETKFNSESSNYGINIDFQCGIDDEYDHNYGGIIGLAQSTKIEKIDSCNTEFSIASSDLYNLNYNFGTFIGQVQGGTVLRELYINSVDANAVLSGNERAKVNYGIVGNVNEISFVDTITITGNYLQTIASNINFNFGTFGLVKASSSGLTILNVQNNIIINVDKYTGGNAYATTLSVGGIIGSKTSNRVVLEKVVNNGGAIVLNFENKFQNNAGYLVDRNGKRYSYNAANNTYTCIDDGKVYSEQAGKVGYYNGNVKLEIKYNAATVNIGGLVGQSSGITIKQSVNARSIQALTGTLNTEEDLPEASMNSVNVGGIIGKNLTGSVTINNTINYGDIYSKLENNKKFHLGGLVGDMGNRDLNLTYSFALGNFINDIGNEALVSKESFAGITHSVKNLRSTNSYYVAEFVPRQAFSTVNANYNYNHEEFDGVDDTQRKSYAGYYIDFLGQNSQIAKIYETILADPNNECKIEWKSGNFKLPIVSGINYIKTSSAGSKANPEDEITVDSGKLGNDYVVLKGNTTISDDFTIGVGQVLTSNKKEGFRVSSSDTTVENCKKIVANHGTISNIIFNTYGGNTITDNYGYIMNVGFSDDAESELKPEITGGIVAPIVNNYGGIYAVGSLITYRTGTVFNDLSLSFVTYQNHKNGEIIEGYVTSSIVSASGSGNVRFGAFAVINNGLIQNVYFKTTIITITGAAVMTDDDSSDAIVQINTGQIKTKFVSKPYGDKSSSALKDLVGSGLSEKMWHVSPSANGGYPYIKGGIKLVRVFKDGDIITTVAELNDWIGSLDGINTLRITIDIMGETEDFVVEGGDITNYGQINVINLYSATDNPIVFSQAFIENNIKPSGTFDDAKILNGTESITITDANGDGTVDEYDLEEYGTLNMGGTLTTDYSSRIYKVIFRNGIISANNNIATLRMGANTADEDTETVVQNGLVSNNMGDLRIALQNTRVVGECYENNGNITISKFSWESKPASGSTLKIVNNKNGKNIIIEDSTEVVKFSSIFVEENYGVVGLASAGTNNMLGAGAVLKVAENNGTIQNINSSATERDRATIDIENNNGSISGLNLTHTELLISNNGDGVEHAGTIDEIELTGGKLEMEINNSYLPSGASDRVHSVVSNVKADSCEVIIPDNYGTVDTISLTKSRMYITNNGSLDYPEAIIKDVNINGGDPNARTTFEHSLVSKNFGSLTFSSGLIENITLKEPLIGECYSNISLDLDLNNINNSGTNAILFGILYSELKGQIDCYNIEISNPTVVDDRGNYEPVGIIAAKVSTTNWRDASHPDTSGHIKCGISFTGCKVSSEKVRDYVGLGFGIIHLGSSITPESSDKKIEFKTNAVDDSNQNKLVVGNSNDELKRCIGGLAGECTADVGTTINIDKLKIEVSGKNYCHIGTVFGLYGDASVTGNITVSSNVEMIIKGSDHVNIGGVFGIIISLGTSATLNSRIESSAQITLNSSCSNVEKVGGVIGYLYGYDSAYSDNTIPGANLKLCYFGKINVNKAIKLTKNNSALVAGVKYKLADVIPLNKTDLESSSDYYNYKEDGDNIQFPKVQGYSAPVGSIFGALGNDDDLSTAKELLYNYDDSKFGTVKWINYTQVIEYANANTYASTYDGKTYGDNNPWNLNAADTSTYPWNNGNGAIVRQGVITGFEETVQVFEFKLDEVHEGTWSLLFGTHDTINFAQPTISNWGVNGSAVMLTTFGEDVYLSNPEYGNCGYTGSSNYSEHQNGVENLKANGFVTWQMELNRNYGLILSGGHTSIAIKFSDDSSASKGDCTLGSSGSGSNDNLNDILYFQVKDRGIWFKF